MRWRPLARARCVYHVARDPLGLYRNGSGALARRILDSGSTRARSFSADARRASRRRSLSRLVISSIRSYRTTECSAITTPSSPSRAISVLSLRRALVLARRDGRVRADASGLSRSLTSSLNSPFHLLSFVCVTSLHSRNLMAELPSDVPLRICGSAVLFLPLGARFSFDSVKQSLAAQRERSADAFAIRLAAPVAGSVR